VGPEAGLYDVKNRNYLPLPGFELRCLDRLRGVKRQECEADHLYPSSAKVKNGGAIPPLPHMSLQRLYFLYVWILGCKGE
jgi:hypothetical protein